MRTHRQKMGRQVKNNLIAGTVVALGLVASGQIYAADLPARPYYKAAPIAYLPWNKCYVGVTAGYTKSSDTDPSITSTDPNFLLSQTLGNVPTRLSTDPDGAVVGGTIGCNRQYDRIVLGLETDLTYSSLRNSVAVVQGPAVTTTQFDRRIDAIGTLRGRLGYAFDNTLFYATGGLAYGHVKSFTHIFSAPGNPELIGTEDSWKVGWTIGAGVEHMFAPNWSVKGEYLYYDLGNSNVNLLPAGGAPEFALISYKNTGHIIRAGLNYHFSTF